MSESFTISIENDNTGELARQAIGEGYQAVALELGKNYEALQVENAALKAQLAEAQAALVETIEDATTSAEAFIRRAEQAESERDRLKAALKAIANPIISVGKAMQVVRRFLLTGEIEDYTPATSAPVKEGEEVIICA